MKSQRSRRSRGLLIGLFAVAGLVAFSGTSWAWWMETQLAGVRLGDSAYVLLGMPGYGNPDAIVVATSQSAAGPATSEGTRAGTEISGLSRTEGPGAGGGAAGAFGPGGAGAGAGPGGMGSSGMGPGGPMGGRGGPGMRGGPGGGPMGGGGGGRGGMAPGTAMGFWGSARPGTLNTQAGIGMMGPAPGMGSMAGGPGGPPMPPMGGMGGMGGGARPGMPGGGGMMGAGGLPGAGGAVGGGAAGLTLGGGPGSGVSSFPDWALSVWFDLRENEVEWFYMRDGVAVGFVVNKLDGKIVAISVAGEKCDFARTSMWKPHEYVQLGDSFKQVLYRYGWPHDLETFNGSGDPTNAGLITGGTINFGTEVNSFRRDCILWYHEVRGEKQCNVAFTLHDLHVTRIHIWIPELD